MADALDNPPTVMGVDEDVTNTVDMEEEVTVQTNFNVSFESIRPIPKPKPKVVKANNRRTGCTRIITHLKTSVNLKKM